MLRWSTAGTMLELVQQSRHAWTSLTVVLIQTNIWVNDKFYCNAYSYVQLAWSYKTSNSHVSVSQIQNAAYR